MNLIALTPITALTMLGFLFGRGDDKKVKDDVFEVGQVWHYDTRSEESGSTLTIVQLDQDAVLGTIVHVHIEGVLIKSPSAPKGYSNEIHHMPFSKEALRKSVTEKVGQVNKLPDYKEGYDQWYRAFASGKGGIFTIPVKEAVAYIEQVMNQ